MTMWCNDSVIGVVIGFLGAMVLERMVGRGRAVRRSKDSACTKDDDSIPPPHLSGTEDLEPVSRTSEVNTIKKDKEDEIEIDKKQSARNCQDTMQLWMDPLHPEWQPPEATPEMKQMREVLKRSNMHSLDTETASAGELYALCISAVVPRPIALVSTLGLNGERNLAPYSYFNVVSHDPPHVVIGCCVNRAKSGGQKDTLKNIMENREFVVNIISNWFVEAANHCCGNFDYGMNEMEISGLTPIPSTKINPPRVLESSVHLECILANIFDIRNSRGDVTTTLVIGKVIMMHVSDAVAGLSPSGKLVVDVQKLKPISRLGGNTYGQSYGLFDLPRPDRKI